ncbi:MAG: BON domain-containing protein [Anaerolineae bacterium]|nr:BON domain-containing protein [Anaerolineae bacterium]
MTNDPRRYRDQEDEVDRDRTLGNVRGREAGSQYRDPGQRSRSDYDQHDQNQSNQRGQNRSRDYQTNEDYEIGQRGDYYGSSGYEGRPGRWEGQGQGQSGRGQSSGGRDQGMRSERNYNDQGYQSGDERYGSGSSQGRGMSSGQHRGKGPQGYQRSDDRIMEEACEILTDHDQIDAGQIQVQVSGGEITLEGTVSDRYQKRMAEDVLEGISGVKEIHNRLRVQQAMSIGQSGMSGQSGSQGQSSETTGHSGTQSQITGQSGQTSGQSGSGGGAGNRHE